MGVEEFGIPSNGQTPHRVRLLPGERPLVGFISSVMTPDLQWARNEIVAALDAVPFTVPWSFEHTPASSEQVDSGYLRHVREADFLIWLAADAITQPVIDELNEALSARVPIIALLLPADARSEQLQRTIASVRPHAKYRQLDAADAAELRLNLDAAMGDEIVRAMRGLPSMGRLARIEELGRASRARVIERLLAAGVPAPEATAIADDVNLGPKLPAAEPTVTTPLVVLSSTVGAGKSLFGERQHQLRLADLMRDGSKPIPVWLAARDAEALDEAVAGRCEALGDPRVQGAAVVIDGADEAGPAAADHVLAQARVLVRAWPTTTVLLTTRPLPGLGDASEVQVLPPLSDEEARMLVGRVAGADMTVGRAAGWPQPVHDAIRRPLFAVLLGASLRSGDAVPQSRAELVAALAERAARRTDVEPALRRLAVASLQRGGGPVPTAEVATPSEADDLLTTRLVAARGNALLFPLIIFAHWFAAAALAEQDLELDALLEMPTQLDDWLYPMAICVARYRPDQVTALLSTLARRRPAFASQVVDEATSRWGFTDIASPPSLQAAREVRHATEAWVDGIGPLAPVIAPLRNDGSLASLGASASGPWLTLVWYRGSDRCEPVFEMPSEFSMFDAGWGWGPGKAARPGTQAGWAWRWSLEGLSDVLKEVLKDRSLPVRGTPLFDPALYELVARLNNHGALTADTFDIAATQAMVEPDTDLLATEMGATIPVTGLYADLQALLDAGVRSLTSPFPGPDRDHYGSGWIWDPYSPQRMLERTIAVYSCALAAYEHYVQHYFAALADRMPIAVTLPAALTGSLAAPTSPTHAGGPIIHWHFEALPEGEASRVELRLDQNASFISRAPDDVAYQRLHAMRPNAARWLRHVEHGSVLDVFNVYDARELVYSWLWSDLVAIKWVQGSLPSRGSSYDLLKIR